MTSGLAIARTKSMILAVAALAGAAALVLPAQRFVLVVSAFAALLLAFLVESVGGWLKAFAERSPSSANPPTSAGEAWRHHGVVELASGTIVVGDSWEPDALRALDHPAGSYSIWTRRAVGAEDAGALASVAVYPGDAPPGSELLPEATHLEYRFDAETGFLVLLDAQYATQGWSTERLEQTILDMLTAKDGSDLILRVGDVGLAAILDPPDAPFEVARSSDGRGLRLAARSG